MSATGSCACGAITFEVTWPLRPVVACHCTQCRKASGHYVAATAAAREDIAIIGDVTWFQSSDTARRGFCGVCGSNLFWDGHGGTALSIHAGTLDGDPGICLAGHIFCADKGTYYGLPDTLPKSDDGDLNIPEYS